MEDRRFPNLFWPVLLIGLGALLFMSNLGVIEPINLNVLWRLWPVFLVLIGINMLFGRGNRMVTGLISVVLALAVIAFLYFAPTIVDSLPTPEMVTESFDAPLAGVDAADINLDFDRGNLTVNALEGGGNLFEAVVKHNEKLTFRTSGTSQTSVRLSLNDVGTPQFGDWVTDQQIQGDVGLAVGVPMDMDINIGSGNAVLNLTALELTKLDANSGSGRLEVYLPTGDFRVNLGSGSGSVSIETAEDQQLDLKATVGSGRITIKIADGCYGEVNLESGSGGITVTIPEGVAVEVEGDTGSGSVNVPRDFVRTSGGDGLVGDSGTWESPGFSSAADKLYIRFDVGSGSLRVQYP